MASSTQTVHRRIMQRRSQQRQAELKKNTVKKKTTLKSLLETTKGEIDYTFLFIVILVLVGGLVMLLSASAPKASEMYDDSYFFFRKQFRSAVAGVLGMWIVSRINYKYYMKWINPAVFFCMLALLLVAIPGVGTQVNGSRRWLFGIQPSEFMKPLLAMFIARSISLKNPNLKSIRELVPYIVMVLAVDILMILEPHLSGAIIMTGIAAVMLISAGMPFKPILAAAVPGIGAIALGCKLFSATRWARITSFINPFSNLQTAGYQISQSIYAIGSGKLFGLGLGESIQKYGYLPEPYNDFIFAIICEELGFVGATLVVALFAVLIIRGIRIAMNAPDRYSTLLAAGIVTQIAIQTILNIAVATSSIPNTGVSLPFFSYGGTSVFTLLLEMGMLLNISRYSETE